MSVDPRIGTELAGYRIESLLGRGGMSVVYLAEHGRLQRKVALKILAPELAEDQRFRVRFIRESQLAASLDHPNIVPIYEAGEVDGVLFIAMRYVEGTDLKALVEEQGPLDPPRAIAILRQVAAALDAAHARGLVHRDVKSSNVLVASSTGEEEHAYLSDFGLTKGSTADSGVTGTGQFLGTVDYAAPEQFQGWKVDGRADQYSLACVAYESLVGAVPFPRDQDVATMYAHLNEPPPRPSEHSSELPPAVDGPVARAMAKRTEDRYPTCREFVSELDRSVRSFAPTPVRPRRRPTALVAAAAAIAAAAAVTLVLVFRSGGTPARSAPSSPAAGTPTTTTSAASSFISFPAQPNTVVEIDPSTGRSAGSIDVGVSPSSIVVAGGKVWVVNFTDNTLSRIDIDTDTVDQTLGSVGPGPIVGLIARGSTVWVAGGRAVTPIDARSGVVGSPVSLTLPVCGGQSGGGFLWLAAPCTARGTAISATERSMFRVDPRTGAVSRYPVKDLAFEGAWSNGGVWLVDYDAGNIARLEPTTGDVEPLGSVVDGPISIVAAPDGMLWISDYGAHSLVELDPTTRRVVSVLELDSTPGPLAAGLGSIWVGLPEYQEVVQVDPQTAQIIRTIETSGADPNGITTGAGRVWVTEVQP